MPIRSFSTVGMVEGLVVSGLVVGLVPSVSLQAARTLMLRTRASTRARIFTNLFTVGFLQKISFFLLLQTRATL